MNSILLKVRSFMKSEVPVFIVGAPRSGSSLLYRMLQNHSSFKLGSSQNSAQINLTEAHIFQKPYNAFTPNLLSYMLNDKMRYNDFLGATKWIRKYQELLSAQNTFQKIRGRPKLSLVREFFWQLTMSDFLVATFFYYAKQARGVERILEKTPSSISQLPEIKKTFPEAKLLFIHRHPIDVFTSYKKRLKISTELNFNKSSLYWLKISPKQFCYFYEQQINLALKENTNNSRHFMLIPYENLTKNPQETLSKICDFLGEPYQEKCLVTKQSKSPDWKVDPYLYSEVKEVTKNWKDFINETDARLIEEQLHEVMSKLGYLRYT